MTCIVGIEADGKVLIGGDAAGSDGKRLMIMAEPKVFRRGRFVIGYTTSFRMGQLLQHTLKAPTFSEEWRRRGVHAFMTVRFMDAVRKCLADGGWLTTKNEQIEGGQFLVGFKDQLYVVEGDMQIGRVEDGFYAVGSGADLALGAICAARTIFPEARSELDALNQAQIALLAAERFAVGVQGPFTFESTR